MMARLMWQAVAEIDVRGVLESVRTPTLVLGRKGDRIAPIESARELAERIPNAELRFRRANTMPPIWSTCCLG